MTTHSLALSVSLGLVMALAPACGDEGQGEGLDPMATGFESTEGGEGTTGETSDGGGESTTDEPAGETSDTGATEAGAEAEAGGETEGEDTGTDPDPDPPNERPENAPDWVVIAVSGHCIPPGCELPGSNHEYLEKQGTAGRFADTLTAWGNEVALWSYSDEFYNRDLQLSKLVPGQGAAHYYGFLELVGDLEFIRDNWIADYDNPTRILVVAHSHGAVWAHTALHVVDDAPIDVLVTIDGKSLGWESDDALLGFGDDWAAEISAYSQANAVSWPFDITNPEGGWNVPGVGTSDVEDVVPDSVDYNIELQAIFALDLPIADGDDNYRTDGSEQGIHRFHSQSENHSEIAKPNSQGVNWALAKFGELVG